MGITCILLPSVSFSIGTRARARILFVYVLKTIAALVLLIYIPATLWAMTGISDSEISIALRSGTNLLLNHVLLPPAVVIIGLEDPTDPEQLKKWWYSRLDRARWGIAEPA